MNFAIDTDGIKIKPEPNKKGFCQLCGGPLIAHCGQIYSWHWKHQADRDCDPWHENETKWHRDWKSRFPENWQEVILENEFGEKHIADIKTVTNTVIEFQNSPISSATIEVREAFYGQMIWVVNATPFVERLDIRSIVTTKLRDIDSQYSYASSLEPDPYDSEIKLAQKAITDTNRNISNIEKAIEKVHSEINLFTKTLQQIDSTIELLINKWNQRYKGSNFYNEPPVTRIIGALENTYKLEINSILNQKLELNNNRKVKEELLRFIESHKDILIEGEMHKVIKYNGFTKESFRNIKVISKLEKDSLFPKILRINSEGEYLQYGYNQDKYIFAGDVSQLVLKTKLEIQNIETDHQKLNEEFSKLKPRIGEELQKILSEGIDQSIANIKKLEIDLNNLYSELAKNISDEHHFSRLQTQETAKIQTESEHEKQNKKLEIMKSFKGRYTYDWKHKRPSWRVAKAPIFIDIGEDYLFHIYRKGYLKKITIDTFLRHYQRSKF